MLNPLVRIAAGLFAITALSGFTSRDAGVLLIPTDSPEWRVLSFGGYPAERLYGALEMQHELSCKQDVSGAATCRAWVNRDGDLRNAAPTGVEQIRYDEALPGIIMALTQNPDEPTIFPFNIRSQALVEFLASPFAHDLFCRGNNCRFSVDERGVVEPLPFPILPAGN